MMGQAPSYMSEYRRYREHGGTFFFTVVSFGRRPIFTTALARACLRNAFRETRFRYPFILEAISLLPEHLHCLWTLPKDDDDYSTRWALLKGEFTKAWLAGGGTEGFRNASRRRKGEAAVWQRRFWEHTIRDQQDFNNHFDYIHYNPVHHELVKWPEDWPWSTYHKFVREGFYEAGWGDEPPPGITGIEDRAE